MSESCLHGYTNRHTRRDNSSGEVTPPISGWLIRLEGIISLSSLFTSTLFFSSSISRNASKKNLLKSGKSDSHSEINPFLIVYFSIP